jgi:hypothetical protein
LDNGVLDNVLVKVSGVNGGAWQGAGTTNGLKNWSTPVTLKVGTNTIFAYSKDRAGNCSLTSSVTCVYTETGTLNIITNGPGKVTVAPIGPLLLGKIYTLTAAANAGGVFSNWTGAVNNPTNKVTTFTMTSNMTITANFTDNAKPTVTITAPLLNQRITDTNPVYTVKGAAADNSAVATVKVRLNSGDWTNAVTTNAWKSWSVPVMLSAGSNLVQAYSTDSAGNISAPSSVSCTYAVMTPINLEIVGLGKVAGVTNGQLLEIGKTITLTATPATYYLLTDWQVQVNGSTVLSTNRVVPFVMQSNLTLKAAFTPGPGLAQQDIRAFYAEMKRLVETHDKAGFFALFSPDYMHRGNDLAVVTSDLDAVFSTIKTFTFNITSITVTGDCAKVHGVVTVSFNNGTPSQTWSEPDMIGNSSGFGWLKKTSDGWRVIGDQKRASVGVKTKHDTTPGSNSYYFVMWADSPLQVTSAHVSGFGIDTTSLGAGGVGEYAGLAYSGDFTSLTKPPVGSVYTFVVEFADGSQETYQDTIKSWVMTAPVVTTKPTASSDVIRWNSASIPDAANYVVWVSGGGSLWISEELPLTQLSIAYDEDGTASGPPLVPGVTYTIRVEGKNKTSDCAYLPVTFKIPAATPAAVADISSEQGSAFAPTSQPKIVVDGSSKDWTDVSRSSFSYASTTQEVAVALDGNNIALLLNGCPFNTSDAVLVYFKLRLTYGTADDRHTVDLWTSGSVLCGMIDGQMITGLEAVLLNGVLEVKIPVEQAPSQVTIEEVGCGMDLGGTMKELFRITSP